jgi:hypothetical protein
LTAFSGESAQQPRIRTVGLGALFGPRNTAISAGSPKCATVPAAASSSTTYRQPVQPPTELRIPVEAMLAQVVTAEETQKLLLAAVQQI